jgi:CheY-like chemotaxis protein
MSHKTDVQKPAALVLAAPEATVPVGPKTILVIDDELIIQRTLRRALEDEHAITVPETGKEALALLERGNRFDLILCDVVMPELSGIELYETLSKLDPDQARRVVFITGGGFTGGSPEFQQAFEERHIWKPFVLRELKQQLRSFLATFGAFARGSALAAAPHALTPGGR